METVKLGIIGIGNMGSGHARSLMEGQVPELVLTAVADLREMRRQWARENLPADVRIFEDGDALIESGCCDAVLVATPHYDHPRLVISALSHGSSVSLSFFSTDFVRSRHSVRSGKLISASFQAPRQ